MLCCCYLHFTFFLFYISLVTRKRFFKPHVGHLASIFSSRFVLLFCYLCWLINKLIWFDLIRPRSTIILLYSVQKKTPTYRFFHIFMNGVYRFKQKSQWMYIRNGSNWQLDIHCGRWCSYDVTFVWLKLHGVSLQQAISQELRIAFLQVLAGVYYLLEVKTMNKHKQLFLHKSD